MAKKRFYSIKFPFRAEDDYKFYLDLNTNIYESIKSDITHLLFTPTGSRLRDPRFGSNLIKLLFQPSDNQTSGNIKSEIQGAVKKYLPKVTITELTTTDSEDGRGKTVSIQYRVDEGSFFIEDNINVTL